MSALEIVGAIALYVVAGVVAAWVGAVVTLFLTPKQWGLAAFVPALWVGGGIAAIEVGAGLFLLGRMFP